jgi:hypothetical protein
MPYARPGNRTVTSAEKEIDWNGLVYVVIQAIDEYDVPVILSDGEVTCRIASPARLLSLEAGNNRDMSDYIDNRHRMFNGRILAYIQSLGEAKIRFTSPWLNRRKQR